MIMGLSGLIMAEGIADCRLRDRSIVKTCTIFLIPFLVRCFAHVWVAVPLVPGFCVLVLYSVLG